MIRRTTKVLLEIVALISAGLAILVVVAAFKLASGPLSIGFIAPLIESALEPEDGSFDVSLDEVVLTWGGWERSVRLRAVGVQVRDATGDVRAEIPELTIGLSGRALLHGDLAPTSLEIVGPRLSLRRGEDGTVRFADPPAPTGGAAVTESGVEPAPAAPDDERPQLAGDFANQVFSDLLAPPGPSNKMGYLTSLSVLDADLTLEDSKLAMVWRAPSATFVFLKGARGLRLVGNFGFDVGGETAEFALTAQYDTVEEEIIADLRLADIQPALFAPSIPLFPELAGVKLPLSGTLRLRADFDGVVHDAALDLTGGAGSVVVPGESGDTDIAVQGARLRASLSDDLMSARLDELTIDFGGPSLAMTGSAQGTSRGVIDGAFDLAAELSLRDLPIADLKRIWPASVARNAHRWVTANIAQGTIPEGKIALRGKAGEAGIDDLTLTELSGGFPFRDLSVAYFGTLPPVQKGHGRATVRADGLSFAVAGGEVQGLQVGPGKVDITGLDTPHQNLAVEVEIRGAVRQVLTILDHPRLGYAKALGVKPADMGGDTAVRLTVGLPLLDALTFKQVKLAAAATLRDVTMPKAAFDLDLSAGDLALQLDGRGMDVTGTAVLGRTPVTLAWTENFAAQGFARRIKLQASVDDAGRKEMGLDFGDYVQGPVGIDALMTQNTNRANTVAINADVTRAVLDLRDFGVRKEAGVPGKLVADLALTGETLTAIRKFSLDATGLAASGTVNFAADGRTVSAAKVDKLVHGRSDVSIDLARRGDGGFDIALKGKSFDAAPLLKGDTNDKPTAGAAAGDKPAAQAAETDVTPLGISVALDQLYLGSTGSLAQVTARMDRDRKHWRSVKIDGQPAPGKVVRVALTPDGVTRRLDLQSDDAGSAFRAFGISENVRGGTLRLAGLFDDSKPNAPLIGKLEAENFRLVNAPAIAKLLSVALLTGILDSLRGEGIGFDRLEFPFTLVNDVIETKAARAHGPAIGLTAEGWINLKSDTLGLRGTLVPAYAVNSILNNIPLIGTLLGGPGSGVFAATYRMTGPLEDPDVSVNPLATLAPGFLRGLFGIFDGGVPKQPDALPDPSLEKETPLPPAP